jgi:hypothetical protein
LEDAEGSASRAFAQIMNPPNVDDDVIVDSNLPYGIFISMENAEKVNFRPDASWKKAKKKFTGATEPTEGYISLNPRIVFLHTAPLEVSYRGDDGKTENLGLAYKAGKPTEAGIKAGIAPKEGKKQQGYSLNTRNLVFFVGANKELLHDEPLSFKSRGMLGNYLAKELPRFHLECATYLNPNSKGFPPNVKSLLILDLELDYTRNEGTSPFIRFKSRAFPTKDEVGVSKKAQTKNGLEFTLIGKTFEDLAISKSTPQAATILAAWESNKQFLEPLPVKGAPVPFKATGAFDISTVEVGEDGITKVNFDVHASGKSYVVSLSEERMTLLDEPVDYEIKGILQNGVVDPKMITAIEVEPEVNYDDVAF